MLTSLTPQPADKIIALMKMFREDPRTDKIDLGVGVYKNADGVTPVMRAVKEAEKRLWEAETTKSYVGLAGDPAYAAAMRKLILGDAVPAARVAAAATPGGTGAVHNGFQLLSLANPDLHIWISAPTWPNHPSILRHLGLPFSEYRYFDPATGGVDFEGMMADLKGIGPNDVVLLHGCCHNPTGANLSAEDWDAVIAHLEATGAIPMIDIAYQGFGDGLEEDADGVRRLVARLPEAVIAASNSKNFGVYRERAGLLMAVTTDEKTQALTQGTLTHINRQVYSFPPDHGARLVTMILEDDALRADWQAELEEVRTGMLALRTQLAEELRQRSNSDRFDFLAHHRGMFSLLGATPHQVQALRRDHGIYMVGDSRMNIAGLNAATVPILAEAIVTTGI